MKGSGDTDEQTKYKLQLRREILIPVILTMGEDESTDGTELSKVKYYNWIVHKPVNIDLRQWTVYIMSVFRGPIIAFYSDNNNLQLQGGPQIMIK